ncbi:MAG: flagellar biosynthetic protein FliR [Deltaproteobacteria bacterium]|nr:flagellar biosynthetic protein FliR [Deltaproteobacteria bacterium]
MIDHAAIQLLLPFLATFLAFFARTSAFLLSAPFFSERVITKKSRMAFAAFASMAMTSAHGGIPLSNLLAVLPVELALGAACGFAARLVVYGIETGGQLIGLNVGLGFAETVDPRLGETALPTRSLANGLAALVFFASDGPGAVMSAIAAPLPGSASLEGMSRVIIARSGDVLVAGVRIAAPVVLSTLIVYVALALASRAAPALNLFSVAFSAALLVGGLTLLGTAAGFTSELVGGVGRIQEVVTQVVEARP